MSPQFIILLSTLISLLSGQYNSSTCFRTRKIIIQLEQTTLWSSSDPYKGYTASGYDFPIAWSQTFPDLVSVSLAINSFKTPVNYEVSLVTTVTFTTIDGLINIFFPPNSRMMFCQYSIILVSSCEFNIELTTIRNIFLIKHIHVPFSIFQAEQLTIKY